MNTVDKKEVLDWTVYGVIESDGHMSMEEAFAQANEYLESNFELKYTDRRYVELKVAEWEKNNL